MHLSNCTLIDNKLQKLPLNLSSCIYAILEEKSTQGMTKVLEKIKGRGEYETILILKREKEKPFAEIR